MANRYFETGANLLSPRPNSGDAKELFCNDDKTIDVQISLLSE